MNLFPAQPFDISDIMKIERQSFIPSIQEKQKTFEKRLEVFQNGFLILSDSSEKIVMQNGKALTVGYLCSELWDSLPDKNESDEIFRRKFILNHNPKHTHKEKGVYLYVTSFAMLRDYRGQGLGEKFFASALASLCGAFPEIKKVVLLVNEEWQNALKIYKKFGFTEIKRLKDFFPTLTKIGLFKHQMADGIVMTQNADEFRKINFETNTENPFYGIKL